MSGAPSTFRGQLGVFREGIFAWFMVAEFASMAGSWMHTQGQQLVVEQQARGSWEQAAVSAATMIVIPLFSPLGGVLADRWDKRRILFAMIAIQAVLAALVGWLVQSGQIELWHLIVIAVAIGLTAAFEMPAYSALLPELVPRGRLSAAVAIDRSVFHTARIVGPALAGLAVGHWGAASAFYANALSYLCPLAVLCFVAPRAVGTVEEEKQRRTGFAEGWRHVRADRPTFQMVAIMAANSCFCSPFVIVLLTWYAQRTLLLSPAQTGWLMSISGIGALASSVGILAVAARRRPLILRTGAAMSVCAMLGLAAARDFWGAAVSIAALTMGLNFLFGVGNQLIQERAPDAIRGRVLSVAAMSFVAVIPFSGFLASRLEAWLGMRAALVVCALCYAAVAAAILGRSRLLQEK
jgi:MFS family permease